MSNIASAQKSLVRIAGVLDNLERRVRAAVTTPPEKTKQVPFFITASFRFEWNQIQQREETVYNGGEDVRIYGMTYHASHIAPTETGLADYSVGLGRLLRSVTAAAVATTFEFTWDYRMGRGHQRYMSPTNMFFPMARQSLGRRETQKHLRFKRPQILLAGDSMTFMVQPLAYEIVDHHQDVLLQLVAYGVRDGQMAEGGY